MRMTKRGLAVSAALCAAGALAMPTKEELSRARPLVAELMAEDVAAYKAKSETADAVADTMAKYAQEASTDAAKFLLLKGAVSYYIRGEAYDKAADTVNALQSEITDVPPTVIEEMFRKNMARVTAKKAPRLFAMYRIAQVQVAAAKDAAAAKTALAKKPKDAASLRKLAEALALSGDWNAALETFAKLGGDAGTMAKSEMEKKDLPGVADFWWAYESYLGANDADLFKIHAAEIYRKCQTDGSLDGLKKNIVEKRLKQLAVGDVAAGKGPKDFAIDVGKGEKIEFVACPPGIFMMGYEDKEGPYQKHKVKISRPFWISRYLVTIDQWRALMGKEDVRLALHKERKEPVPCDSLGAGKTPAFGTYRDYVDFMESLGKVNKASLPQGYVFRFPSEAEWEYACKANERDDSPYCKMQWTQDEYAKMCVPTERRYEMLLKKGIGKSELEKLRQWLLIPLMSVGSASPNAWGLYDMIGRHQYTLDTVALRSEPWPGFKMLKTKYSSSDVSVDPLQMCDDAKIGHVVCGDGLHGMKHKGQELCLFKAIAEERPNPLAEMSLRIVIGPDLVSEWKAKHGKK